MYILILVFWISGVGAGAGAHVHTEPVKSYYSEISECNQAGKNAVETLTPKNLGMSTAASVTWSCVKTRTDK